MGYFKEIGSLLYHYNDLQPNYQMYLIYQSQKTPRFVVVHILAAIACRISNVPIDEPAVSFTFVYPLALNAFMNLSAKPDDLEKVIDT